MGTIARLESLEAVLGYGRVVLGWSWDTGVYLLDMHGQGLPRDGRLKGAGEVLIGDFFVV